MNRSIAGALAVCAALAVPAAAQSPQDCFLGEVRMFAGGYEPENWRFADGRLLPLAQNTALFAILGTAFGGNGATTFALPDLRGRFPLGPGQGPGLTERSLGEVGGQEVVTQTVSEMAPHTHGLMAASTPATHIRPQGRVLAKVDPASPTNIYGPLPDVQMSPLAIGAAGGGQPQVNMPPYTGLNFIICVQGLFPSRWPQPE
jgi:microcystin-dependent protein